MRRSLPRKIPFPVLWITGLVFALLAISTFDIFSALICLLLALPLTLLGQFFLRTVLQYLGTPVGVRRALMLFPAMLLAIFLFDHCSLWGRQRHLIRLTLAGALPSGVRNVHFEVMAWTDYSLKLYFECNPASLREILERPPFVRKENTAAEYSSADSFFTTSAPPGTTEIMVFKRTDMPPGLYGCTVYTDATFRFAYISYVAD